MGRRIFFAQQDKVAKEKRRKHLEQSGYVFGAHANEDAIRDKDKRIPKTKRMYRQYAELWKDFLEQNGIRGYDNGPGSKVPDHQLIKEFLRWYIHSTRGRLSKNGRPVVKSVLSCAERFFSGLEEEMQISVGLEDRKEIFNELALNTKQWIQRSLTAEGTIKKINSLNKSFTRKDFIRTVSSLWQTDHHRFIPGLLKVIILLALQLYLFTRARIGAFIPSHEDKIQRGLRYKIWHWDP
ncbi:hypothetical protein NUU61_003970 [Penicillium alfredii]|uniref:Uncharacterized protein n=1 Tax=Penicillium alfredii TaxID=1506179 RepID=A0A9W9FKE7_9EURO|nr:uncharacterized protein NUU61_003970 [Penicillium alfredii]KAJ5101748.1 hypothetical protein NUU61_003970 [Penicillium alfredii]